MSNEVFANNNEISCKSGDGKVIAAFPDVCMSPPSPPAGPVPVPYPVSSFSSDTKDGSQSVRINGKELMLKDQSHFSKCTGDEAATKTLGMGAVSHNIQGKVYFASWSMDVKVEGLNVCRHLDLTTSNHSSPTGDTPTIPELEGMNLPRSMKSACKCKYNRSKHAKGTPYGSKTAQGRTPTTDQTDHVNQAGSKCWRPNCRTPDKGEFIADHQPSLVQRWYKGGCHDPNFGKKAVSVPGTPKGNKEYNKLLPRCKGCYRNAYTNVGLRSPSRRIVPERNVERAKSLELQKKISKEV